MLICIYVKSKTFVVSVNQVDLNHIIMTYNDVVNNIYHYLLSTAFSCVVQMFSVQSITKCNNKSEAVFCIFHYTQAQPQTTSVTSAPQLVVKGENLSGGW